MPHSTLESLAKDLWKEQSRDEDSPDPERCREILQGALSSLSNSSSRGRGEDSSSSVTALWKKTADACQKTFRRQKRQSTIPEDQQNWNSLLELVDTVSTALEANGESPLRTEEEEVEDSHKPHAKIDEKASLPTSVSQYLTRLQQQKKEIYKNPPVLPPVAVIIDEHRAPLPRRDVQTRRLTFAAAAAGSTSSDDTSSMVSLLVRDFHPNVTPEEVLRGGAFGGTYFRTIQSAVTNQTYQAADVLSTTIEPSWIHGLLDSKRLLTSSTYQPAVNKFKVKCGGSLGMWESSGWISDADPYGWFQWYCRFYQGRRCSDDARQISRWKGVAGPKGRFKSQLCNKILAQAVLNRSSTTTAIHDMTISPVIRQTLFHWGLLITEEVLDHHRKLQR